MNTTLRRIAVSGSAAVALLGGAAAITTDTADTASATEAHAALQRAVTAPVTLPDGRTMRVTGLGGYGHQATTEHVATVAAFKADSQPGTAGISSGLAPDSNGSGAQLQNPYSNQVPAGYNQQITTQASGGVIGVGVVAVLVLGIIVFVRVKHRDIKPGDAVLVGLLGISLAGTVIGTMGHQITTSLIGSLGGVIGGLG